jgi:sRNA-binding regulator protein Hfq
MFRPPLARKEPPTAPAQRASSAPPRKQTPPDTTNAENFYFVKQMQSKTPMVIVLKDGEVLNGVIEWYDKLCVKLNRDGEPNLLVYKAFIKYLYKA